MDFSLRGRSLPYGSFFLSSPGTAGLMKCRVLALSKGRRELKANNMEKVKSPASERSKKSLRNEISNDKTTGNQSGRAVDITKVLRLTILVTLDFKRVNLGMRCQESSRLLNYWPGLKPLVFSQYSKYDKFIFVDGPPQK